MNFFNLERMETKNNPADSLCHTKSTTPVLKRQRFQDLNFI